ncbi:antirestriction protein ArdA [Candidatus Formimonas warabiya]|uniref:Uncharacterized protein n=1 Tax=Formimonas warabiya TaxID=1761012 RepID=A0A3G1KTM7_FORW1|nr:antirestriction protein ArdA [Candidatus Formimonas warabiya]ATW25754.1 hypothetical protein DCMF_14170 [Candidatus Formimonas warabiya]
MSQADSPIIKLGITNANYYNCGLLVINWIELPTEEEILRKKLAEMEIDQDDDYIVLEVNAPFKCTFPDHLDIFELNNKLNRLGCLDPAILTAISKYDTLPLMRIVDIALDKKYVIYENVTNEEDLGRRLYQEHQLPFQIPKDLEKYIDFQTLGHEACLKDAIRFIPDMHIAEKILCAS